MKGMKYLLLCLISLPAFSNTFELTQTGGRFKLIITKETLQYSSESLKKTFRLNECSLQLAKSLNAELIQFLPRTPAASGLPFKVDEKLIHLSKSDELTSRILAMDQRILRFQADERAECK